MRELAVKPMRKVGPLRSYVGRLVARGLVLIAPGSGTLPFDVLPTISAAACAPHKVERLTLLHEVGRAIVDTGDNGRDDRSYGPLNVGLMV
jgi:hypothetical protein